MTKSDTLIGLILMGVAVAALTPAWTFASVPGMRFGAWTFPVFVTIALGLSGAALTIKSLLSGSEVPEVAEDGVAEPKATPSAIIGFILIVAATLFYIFAADALGFLVTSALIVLALSLFFWRRPIPCLILTLVSVPVAELIFARAFSVPLPRGLLSVTGLF
ncbi:tripartite tricarboxylate transporter TctB family protein [Roseicyclus sp. F158]|uniref:Tripartite tricarboxylate transporter TctB family protein n=1 Tax=Tropicimonas omnivorans TaxID=3075590 RepID=A0ABU3DLH5_9RHOB|nr:tripartite tricarboxylate transporter TctB family protein [Roseicyclus sp. F158]MDT0684574.1 tripartite tricarboxylate transporter TctB family protein [Roseicyclus sp. F158]